MNNKIIAAAIALAIALAIATLSGCVKETSASELTENKYPGYVYVYVDPGTGVEYLIWKGSYSGGITPRLNADGSAKVVEDE